MNPHFKQVVCLECGHVVAADIMSAACEHCGSAWLDARYDYAAVGEIWRTAQMERREVSLWRYADLLPISQPDPEISLSEGYTPLIRLYPYERLYGHTGIYVKDERQGPTGSFKDRQAVMAVTAMRKAGITECVLASTGNAAAAYAAYCARAGIKLWLFMSSSVMAEKLREAALYGAEVVKVSGTYDETKAVAAEFAKTRGIYLDRGAKAIPGKESMKTLAFEIAEQLGLVLGEDGRRWVVPDWYIQAVSGGIGPLGVWKGFTELHRMGLIDRLPKLGIIQAAGCAPMVRAYETGQPNALPVTPQTLITVLATGDPGFAYSQLRHAVSSQGGRMLSIEDGETFTAMRSIASRAGLSVEPATAVAFAGLERLLSEGAISAGETVVVNCSGHTFSAESHILGNQYMVEMDAKKQAVPAVPLKVEHSDSTKILVVDDNPNDRRLIRRLLKAQPHYEIIEAGTGREGLKAMFEHHPQLVILDLNLPDMDGFTVLNAIDNDPKLNNIPVMVYSGENLTPEQREKWGGSIRLIIQKATLDRSEFISMVGKALS